ncbi:MAG: Fe-S cluster assembly protein HesB [Planctomycetes bacterium]|nr:Fe-S cluster assembly protein HesB [Planctomycetota bacterium]
MATHKTRLPVPPPFELRLCLFGHGWVALEPHQFDEARQRFTTALRVGRQAVDAELWQLDDATLQLQLTAEKALSRAEVQHAARQLRHMLRLDCDLDAFWTMCRDVPRLAWTARRGGGRLLRSATMFEDLMKLLFTTNTSWAATESMTRNLVAAAGTPAPSGRRAFPTPKQCLKDVAFYKDVVRCGYRADAALRLADAFVRGELDCATFLAQQPSEELWKRLVSLHGFGTYAAGQAMRLCGHYDKLAIDSWCRTRLAQLDGTKKPPGDAAIAKRYAKFAPFDGLAMWCDLTAEWHGE